MVRFALRLIAGVLALVCLAVLGLFLVASLPQAEDLRRTAAEGALSHLWGEPVSVHGAVGVRLWPAIVIDMDDVDAVGTDGANARVDRLTFSLPGYGALAAGDLRYRLAVSGARFDVPLDGADDASAGSLLESPIHVLSLLPHLAVRDTVVRFVDAPRGWLFQLDLNDLKSTMKAGRNTLAADGRLNGQPLTLGFAFDLEVQKGERERPYGAEITLTAPGASDGLSARLDVRAPTSRFDHGLAMEFTAKAGSLAQVLTLAGIAPSFDGTGTVKARLDAEPDRLGVSDLALALILADGEHISVTGHATDLASLAGVDLKVVADLNASAASAVSLRNIVITRLSGVFRSRAEGLMLDDTLIETNAFDQTLREIGPISVRSVERDEMGHVAFMGISVIAGPPARPIARLAGDVKDVLGLTGVKLAGNVDIPVASVLELPPEAQDKLGRLVGSLAMSDDKGGLAVDSFVTRIEGSDLITANLSLALEDLVTSGVPASVQMDARVAVPNYSAFAAALGDTSDFRGAVKFEGRLSGTIAALTMDGRTDIGRTQINGTLTSIAAANGRSMVKGTISAPVLYADEIASFLRPESRSPRPEGRGRRKPVAVSGFSAPQGGSQIDVLGTTDADVSISADRLEAGGDRATRLQAHLGVKDGAVRVDPLRLSYHGGVISGVMVSEGRSVLRAKGSGQGWPLSSLLGRGSPISVTGSLRIGFDLTARMDAADPLSTLGGTFTGWVGRGKLGTGLLDLAGVGIIAGLFTSSVQKGESVLQCAKVPLVFRNGVGRTDPAIVVTTENVQALARGTVDLVRNRIDLRVVPRPLHALNGEPGHSFTVKGPLSGPAIELASSGGIDLRGRHSCK